MLMRPATLLSILACRGTSKNQLRCQLDLRGRCGLTDEQSPHARHDENDTVESHELKGSHPGVDCRIANDGYLDDGGDEDESSVDSVARALEESPPVRKRRHEADNDLDEKSQCKVELEPV